MRRWIGFACAAAALCAAAWHFGRPNKAPVASPTTVAAVTPASVEASPAPPPKVLDVIDLARAYEPVPEPEQVLPGGIDPATFIEEPSAPLQIPPAVELEEPGEDLLAVLQATSCLGWGLPTPERAQTLVWELLSPSGVGHWIQCPSSPGDPAYVPRGHGRRHQRVAIRGHIDFSPMWVTDTELWPEVLDILPRETGLQIAESWQESLAAWLIASWSGPTTYPKLIPVAPGEDLGR
jgi:hypothetical protein